MASSIVLDNVASKATDNSLIVLINSDGTVSVDPNDLKNVLENKNKNATVSLVRVGKPITRDSEDESDDEDVSQVNMTVEGFYSPSAATAQDLIDDLGDDLVDDDTDIDLSSLSIVDPASNSIHIDHCYTNRLSNRQLLELSRGDIKSDVQAQLQKSDGVENCSVFHHEDSARGKLKIRGIRGGKKEFGGRRSVVGASDIGESNAATLQRIVLKPPPNSPASATLVPLVKPLVLKQVARREMSRGERNILQSGKHESTLDLFKPPPKTPASALLAPCMQLLIVSRCLQSSLLVMRSLLKGINLHKQFSLNGMQETRHSRPEQDPLYILTLGYFVFIHEFIDAFTVTSGTEVIFPECL